MVKDEVLPISFQVWCDLGLDFNPIHQPHTGLSEPMVSHILTRKTPSKCRDVLILDYDVNRMLQQSASLKVSKIHETHHTDNCQECKDFIVDTYSSEFICS